MNPYNELLNEINQLPRNLRNLSQLQIKKPNLYSKLITIFPYNNEGFKEIRYRLEHNLQQKPICKICGHAVSFFDKNPIHYATYCCKECMQKDKDTIYKKREKTCLEKYSKPNPMQSKYVKNKAKETNLKKYGVSNPQKAPKIKQKSKETCIKKYGVSNPMQNQEIREKFINTNILKFGVANPMQNSEIAKKSYTTRYKQNEYVGTSKIEKEILSYIKEEIDPNIETQYISELYPFHCDYYLPKYDLYIELQAMWTHNSHPYNLDSLEDKDLLKIWEEKASTSKFYKEAIYTWTVRDPLKRKTAEINKLNYLEIFSNNSEEVKYIITRYLEKLNKNETKNI